MPVEILSPSPAPPANDDLSRSVSKLTLGTFSSSISADAAPDRNNLSALTTSAATRTSSARDSSNSSSISAIPASTFSGTLSLPSAATTTTASSSTSSSSSSPLYVPPPSAALPSFSPYLPATLRAAPGQTLTVEGPDNRRHTYNDQGVELGNDPTTGYYEEVEIEDMEWEADERRWTYPCPCGDRFVLTADELMDGECIARCPSCSLVIKVIYDPEDVFEQEGDSDDD